MGRPNAWAAVQKASAYAESPASARTWRFYGYDKLRLPVCRTYIQMIVSRMQAKLHTALWKYVKRLSI